MDLMDSLFWIVTYALMGLAAVCISYSVRVVRGSSAARGAIYSALLGLGFITAGLGLTMTGMGASDAELGLRILAASGWAWLQVVGVVIAWFAKPLGVSTADAR